MERRKFLIGLGGAAAGGAAVFGTGAFDSVEADRDVSVELADDADAYLGLESESEYAVSSSGSADTLELDFTGDNPTSEGGEHFNLQGVTTIEEVFSVQNLGAQDDVEVEFDPDSVDIIDIFVEFDDGTIIIVITDVASIQFIPEDPQIIDEGEEVTYGVVIDHFADDEQLEEEPQLEEFTLTIEAETTNPGEPAESPPDLSEIDALPDDRAERLQGTVDDVHYAG